MDATVANLLTYEQGIEAFRLPDQFSDTERAALMGGTLQQIYGWSARGGIGGLLSDAYPWSGGCGPPSTRETGAARGERREKPAHSLPVLRAQPMPNHAGVAGTATGTSYGWREHIREIVASVLLHGRGPLLEQHVSVAAVR